MVEAAVAPDARLVHRLDLLLGWRHHRDRRRGDRAAGAVDDLPGPIKLADPSPIPALDMQSSSALATLVTTTVINVSACGCSRSINNIGVGAEILGMLVFALILLFFANHQSVVGPGRHVVHEQPRRGSFARSSSSAMFMGLFVVYGFDTAGTFGEETVDASRHAPRGVLSAIWLSGASARSSCWPMILSFKDVPEIRSGQQFAGRCGNPIGDTIKREHDVRARRITLGNSTSFVILPPSTSARWRSRARRLD